jgi:hypothetical protein
VLWQQSEAEILDTVSYLLKKTSLFNNLCISDFLNSNFQRKKKKTKDGERKEGK